MKGQSRSYESVVPEVSLVLTHGTWASVTSMLQEGETERILDRPRGTRVIPGSL